MFFSNINVLIRLGLFRRKILFVRKCFKRIIFHENEFNWKLFRCLARMKNSNDNHNQPPTTSDNLQRWPANFGREEWIAWESVFEKEVKYCGLRSRSLNSKNWIQKKKKKKKNRNSNEVFLVNRKCFHFD